MFFSPSCHSFYFLYGYISTFKLLKLKWLIAKKNVKQMEASSRQNRLGDKTTVCIQNKKKHKSLNKTQSHIRIKRRFTQKCIFMKLSSCNNKTCFLSILNQFILGKKLFPGITLLKIHNKKGGSSSGISHAGNWFMLKVTRLSAKLPGVTIAILNYDVTLIVVLVDKN